MTNEKWFALRKYMSIFNHSNAQIESLKKMRDSFLDLRFDTPEGREDAFLREHVDRARDLIFQVIETLRAIRNYAGDEINEIETADITATRAGYERINEILKNKGEDFSNEQVKELETLYLFCPVPDTPDYHEAIK